MDNQLLCEGCGWTGKREDCREVLREILGAGGAGEPHLQCPKCSSEKLIELTGRGAILEPVLVG